MRALTKDEIKMLETKQAQVAKKYGISKLRTVIYARKSAADEKQTSLPTQIELCKEFILKYPFLELKGIYQEDDRSGMFSENREQYLAMLNKVESGEIDAIVVLRLDRLGRDVADMTTAIKLLNAFGCTLLAGDDISNNNTSIGEFMRGILLCQNQYQARVTATRVMESEIHNVQSGTSAGGQAPYGLQVVNKQFEIDESEAPAIILIFNMYAKGNSYKKIIEKLTSLGYYTRKKRPFSYSTLNGILRNDKYYGTYVYNREDGKRRKNRVLLEKFDEVKNEKAIPPIISKTLFDKVQKLLVKNNACRPHQNANPAYILTGNLKCSCCGSSMSGQSTVGGRNKKRTRNYVCPNHLAKRGITCKTKPVNAEYLETAIKNIIVDVVNKHLSNKGTSNSIFEVLKKTQKQELSIIEKKLART